MKSIYRVLSLLVAGAALLLPAAAAAHVTVSPAEAPADGYTMLEFAVPHGCDGKATNRIVVRMPPEVIAATPEEVPGWKIGIREGRLENPVEQDGEKVTTGPRQISWTGGPLPDHHLLRFGLSVALRGAAGSEAGFPVIQRCAGGAETAWIQKPAAGGPEPEHPVPTVTLIAAGEDHEAASAPATTGDSSGDGLAIAALVVAAAGLLAGGAALWRSRR